VVLKRAIVKRAAFTGECGQTDTVRVNLPRRASRVRVVYPKRGNQLVGLGIGDFDENIARITAISKTRRRVIWRAAPNARACGPDDSSWTTRRRAFGIRLRQRRRVFMSCTDRAGLNYFRRYRPRSCIHFGNNGSFAGGFYLARLHWRGWNRRTARATGIERGFHLPFLSIPARVKVYRVRLRCGKAVYTRAKATTRFGTSRVRLEGCPGPTYDGTLGGSAGGGGSQTPSQ